MPVMGLYQTCAGLVKRRPSFAETTAEPKNSEEGKL